MTLAAHPPSGWCSVQLGSLVTTFGGLSGKSKADFGTGNATYVPFTAVIGQTRLSGDALERVAVGRDEKQHQVQRGDVLLNGSSETPDEVALASVVDFQPDPQTYLNSFCFGLRRIADAPVSPLFLAYLFRGPVGRALVAPLAQGSTRYNIAKTKLMQLELRMPSLEEQKTIARVLADVDDLVKSNKRAIAKKKDVREALLQQLLTGKTRLSGFGGRVAASAEQLPSDWESVPFMDCGEWKSGGTPRTTNNEYWDGDIPWISAKSLTDTRISDSDRRVTRLGAENGTRLVPRETILCVVRGMSLKSEFRVGITTREVAFGQDCKAILPSDSFEPDFLMYAVSAQSRRVLTMVDSAGHGTGRLDTRDLGALPIPRPTLGEQRAVANVLRDADGEIAALERRLEKTLQIQQGMMQELLTGRTRLPTGEGQEAAA